MFRFLSNLKSSTVTLSPHCQNNKKNHKQECNDATQEYNKPRKGAIYNNIPIW